MKLDVSLCLALVAWAIGTEMASAVPGRDPQACVEYSWTGYCLEWDVPPERPVSTGGRTGPGTPPPCRWVTIPEDLSTDESIWEDLGLSRPPEGVDVVWQSRECADGTAALTFRWIIPSSPVNLAAIARGRILGLLPPPAVSTSPPLGTASLVDVPVFVHVDDWTGVVSDAECAAGQCVTVTATPSLRFTSGEPGSEVVVCQSEGTRYAPDGPSLEDQATGACSYAYRLRTGASGRPAAWDGSAAVTWTISWEASSGAAGTLPSVTRTADLPRAVEEVQALVVEGTTP